MINLAVTVAAYMALALFTKRSIRYAMLGKGHFAQGAGDKVLLPNTVRSFRDSTAIV
jgi:hypothetical protein